MSQRDLNLKDYLVRQLSNDLHKNWIKIVIMDTQLSIKIKILQISRMKIKTKVIQILLNNIILKKYLLIVKMKKMLIKWDHIKPASQFLQLT